MLMIRWKRSILTFKDRFKEFKQEKMEFCSLRVVLKCFSIIFNVFHRFFILLVQNSVFRFKIVFFRLWNDIWSRNRVWNHFVSMEGGLVNLSRLPLPPPRGGVDPQKRGSGGRFGGGSPPPFLDVFHGGLGGAPPLVWGVGRSISDRKWDFWSSNFDDFWKKRASRKNGKSLVLGSENSFWRAFPKFRPSFCQNGGPKCRFHHRGQGKKGSFSFRNDDFLGFP